MILRRFLEQRRRAREARSLLAEALRTPELLRGTSLKPRHASRSVIIHHDEEEGHVVRVHFGIVRHPRPYAFSRQSHKVLEYYIYDVKAGTITVQKGHNLTRAEGRDADD